MRLALVGVAGAEVEPAWAGGGVPAEAAIRGFHSVSLLLDDVAATGAILSDVLGFREEGREDALVRYRAAGPRWAASSTCAPRAASCRRRPGAGSVHHVAFRAADDAAEAEMVRKLAENHGIRATEQKDRNYFRSVYFREPGRVLFEIATDIPGFAVDEPVATLGEALKLPAFLEPRRDAIAAALPGSTDALRRTKGDPTMTTHRPAGVPVLHAPFRPRLRPDPAAAPAAARHRRRRERPDPARAGRLARLGAAVAARQGAGRRHAALLPALRRGRVRRGRRAGPRGGARGLRGAGARGLRARRADRGGVLQRGQHRGRPDAASPDVLAGAALLRAMAVCRIRPRPTCGAGARCSCRARRTRSSRPPRRRASRRRSSARAPRWTTARSGPGTASTQDDVAAVAGWLQEA